MQQQGICAHTFARRYTTAQKSFGVNAGKHALLQGNTRLPVQYALMHLETLWPVVAVIYQHWRPLCTDGGE